MRTTRFLESSEAWFSFLKIKREEDTPPLDWSSDIAWQGDESLTFIVHLTQGTEGITDRQGSFSWFVRCGRLTAHSCVQVVAGYLSCCIWNHEPLSSSPSQRAVCQRCLVNNFLEWHAASDGELFLIQSNIFFIQRYWLRNTFLKELKTATF